MVLSGVQDRLAPLQAWLFPRRLYLQLEDQAITGMILKGSRIVWLERLELPEGVCTDGEPLQTDALGDLLGDWLVERGLAGVRVRAVLPPAATIWRLVEWQNGHWPEQPELELHARQEELALPWPLDASTEGADLRLQELLADPGSALLVTVRRTVLEGWIEVCGLAGVALDGVEAAPLCLWRALAPLLQAAETEGALLVLQIDALESRLQLFDQGRPLGEWELPLADALEELLAALQRWQRFWCQRHPGARLAQLWISGAPPALAAALGPIFACPVRVLDPLEQGWLEDARPADQTGEPLPPLALLWGLVAGEVQA